MIHVVNERLGYHLIILLGRRPSHTGWANHTGSKEFVAPVSARGLIHPYLELLFILVLQGHVRRGGGVGNRFTPSSAILGQFTFRSFPCSSSALLCNIGGGRGLEKVEGEGVVTNPCRLHFPTPLLAGSQLGLVSGERLEGQEKSRGIRLLLLPWAVSLAVAASSPLFCSCKTILLFFVAFTACGPNPWIQEPGFPLMSFQPRSGRPFLLLLISG